MEQQVHTQFVLPPSSPQRLTLRLQKPNIMTKSSVVSLDDAPKTTRQKRQRKQSSGDKEGRKSQTHPKSDRFHKFSFIEKLIQHNTVPLDNRRINKRIYILYTSGSVGANQKLQVYKDYLKQKMMQNSYLCDYKLTQQSNNPDFLVTPVLENGYRVEYSIEFAPQIRASVNVKIDDVIYIAEKIKENYQKYDSFIIICGFDVITYISTSLSFMLENLLKLVIFTGAHFPISYCRNDFINNIIESFTIISLSKGLNDVLIVCKNKGYRATRCIKVKENQMDTIKSPNMHSLASIDIKIRFKYHLFLPTPNEPFNVFTSISEKVHVLKIHLYINKEILRYELKNPMIIGYVIQSYTAANLPYSEELLQIFKDASEQDGKIFVNISQNVYKEKNSVMKQALEKYHIYFGGDMTTEAALAKLAYLIGKGFSKEEIKQKISMNLRGQLTETKSQNQFQRQTQGFMEALQQVLEDYYPTSTQQRFASILQDEIGKYISACTTPNEFQLIYKYFKKSQEPILQIKNIIDRNFLLHHAVRHQNIGLIAYFLQLPIQRDILDHDECSAFFYAMKSCNKSIIQLLYKRSCHVICPCDLLMDIFIAEIKNDNADFFEMLFHIEFKTTLSDIVNREKRNVAHIAALFGAEKCLDMFIVKFKFQLSQKDQYGSTIEDYVDIYRKKLQSRSSLLSSAKLNSAKSLQEEK